MTYLRFPLAKAKILFFHITFGAVTVTTFGYFAEIFDIDNGTEIGLSDQGIGRDYVEGIQPNQTYQVRGRFIDTNRQLMPMDEITEMTAESKKGNGTISDIKLNEEGTIDLTYHSAENNGGNAEFTILINAYPISSFWTNTY